MGFQQKAVEPAGWQTEVCNRRKVYFVDRDGCLSLQYHSVLRHIMSLCVQSHCTDGKNWGSAIRGRVEYWSYGKQLSKYVLLSSSNGVAESFLKWKRKKIQYKFTSNKHYSNILNSEC